MILSCLLSCPPWSRRLVMALKEIQCLKKSSNCTHLVLSWFTQAKVGIFEPFSSLCLILSGSKHSILGAWNLILFLAREAFNLVLKDSKSSSSSCMYGIHASPFLYGRLTNFLFSMSHRITMMMEWFSSICW